MSLVSIIVPVYNTEDWIARCLNSILNQTFEDFEVIVVNDGSTDNSGKICKDFVKQDKRIKYIELVKNGGLSTARNLAITHSAGRLLFFVDSDDYLDSKMLEKAVNCQKKHQCDVVKFVLTIAYNDSDCMPASSGSTKVYTSKAALEEYFLGDHTKINAQICSGLYKKELFRDIKFPDGKVYEDNYVTPMILNKAEKIVFIDYPGYFYYMRENSIMHSGFTKEKALTYNLYKELYSTIVPNYPEFNDLLVERWILRYLYTYRDIVKSRNTECQELRKIIYKEVKEDKAFLLKQHLSNSCKRQLLIFLFSPLLFNICIDFIEWRQKHAK